MLENYKIKWMQNFAKSVGNRTGWLACLHLFNLFFVNIGIIVGWFASLIIIIKLAVNYGFLSNNDAAVIAIAIMNILALTHLIIFVYSKFGDRLITILAEYIAQAFRKEFLGTIRIAGLPAAIKIAAKFESFQSHIPSVPCAPPRSHLA
jgi:hypothetical protein